MSQIQVPQSATVTLTDAQIKALPTTPVTVIAAPGAGKAVVPLLATFASNFTAGAYTAHGEDVFLALFLRTVNGETAVSTYAPASAKFTNATATVHMVGPAAELGTGDLDGVIVGPSIDVNDAVEVVLSGWTQDFTGGDAANTLTVTVVYIVVDL